MAKCPWCNEWEGPPEKYSDHLKYCKKYPPNIEAMKEQARVGPITKEERAKLKRQVEDMLTSMLEDEVKAQHDYAALASFLRQLGYPAEAETIDKIQKGEYEHWTKINEVRNNVRVLSYAY